MTERSMTSRGRVVSEAVGIWKLWKRVRFMFWPCWTEKVWSWAKQQFIIIVLKKMGRRDRKALVSSTCDIVMPSLLTALSRNLQYHSTLIPSWTQKKMVIYHKLYDMKTCKHKYVHNESSHLNLLLFLPWGTSMFITAVGVVFQFLAVETNTCKL